MVMYGFYSDKQRKQVGYAYYNTPGGGLVAVTLVADDPYQTTLRDQFDDFMFISEVTEMVQSFWHTEEFDRNPDTIRSSQTKTDPSIPIPDSDKKICPYEYYGVRPCTCGQCRLPPDQHTRDPFCYEYDQPGVMPKGWAP